MSEFIQEIKKMIRSMKFPAGTNLQGWTCGLRLKIAEGGGRKVRHSLHD